LPHNSLWAILFLILASFAVQAQEPDSTQSPLPNQDLELDNPDNVTQTVEYDPLTDQYVIYNMIGNTPIGPPQYMSSEEYQEYVYQQQDSDYWDQRSNAASGNSNLNNPEMNLLPSINIGGEAFDAIFGSNTVEIIPRGSAELTFSVMSQRTDNTTIPERNRRNTTFNFDEKIQMNVTGKIGDKLQLGTNYDTEATFAFENQMKLEYTGDEDEIIQRLEMGNVNLPLNSTLITGAQSLFGVKGQFKFGKATITTVISEQRSESQTINVEGGARTSEFEFLASNYEANRHFFLAQFFRDQYDDALRDLPVIRSQVQITKIEVYITNLTAQTDQVRNFAAFMDLGEREVNNGAITVNPGPNLPDNGNNSLDPASFANQQVRSINTVNDYLNNQGFNEGLDYVTLENARRLNPNDFTFHPQLGYISLKTSLNNDEVLAVAFQYTYNGQTYQVGEFSTDGVDAPQNLILKLVKSNITDVRLPIWDLMMKNVYNIGAFQVNREDFRLDILYANDRTGTPMNFIPEGSLSQSILLRVMNLDRLNNNNDPQADGVFDWIPGVTITPQNGRIIFPVVEPFGDHLRRQFQPSEDELIERYVYNTLYDSTIFLAQQDAEHDKFVLRGTYKSASGSEIPLNAMNVPQGSVTVTAGGQVLTENVHYTVDYNLGRVKIIDEGLLNSNTPISISLENNSMFSIQARRFVGIHADYDVSDELILGATLLNLSERPITQKVNMGDEPINNTIWGLNGNYTTESRLLTKLVDALPFIETKEISNVNVSGEFAHLIPRSPRGIRIDGDGTSFIDDFENTQTIVDLRSVIRWNIASVPQGQPELFPEGELSNDQAYGYNRALMSWYVVDPLFYRNNTLTPDHIRDDPDMQSNHYVREVLINELFPNRDIPQGQPQTLAVLNLSYYPEERGPYNYDVEPSAYSAGLEADGKLAQPQTRWAGMQREIQSSNFEAANIEFIQFWLLDPFIYDPMHSGGDLYFNLGSISEDILRDNRKSYENGIPVNTTNANQIDTTAWGFVANNQSVVYAFDSEPNNRELQDVGIDGMRDEEERELPFNGIEGNPTYLDRVEQFHGQNSPAYAQAFADPSADNYHYYRGSDYDQDEVAIWDRYKRYNLTQGNSPTDANSPEPYPTASGINPDVEDVNRDMTMDKTEAYYQYRVSIRPQDLRVGTNYVTDSVTASVRLQNGDVESVTWYQFKVPIADPDERIGNIFDFRSIRFIRMFMKNFEDSIHLRFGTLEFVRGDWRRYLESLNSPGESLDDDGDDNTTFDVFAVNLEENGLRSPIPYVIPPGIERQVIFGTTDLQQQNEQALAVRVCDLEDGDARAVWKSTTLDMRLYKRVKMFVHAEAWQDQDNLQDGDITAFVRVGSDFTDNYYEYEIPLQVTPWGTSNPDEIWPEINEFDFAFDELHETKLQRNQAMNTNPDVSFDTPFSIDFGSHKVTVVGNPSTGNVRTIMIGVRNPKKLSPLDGDDGLSKCAEIWFNEFRLTEFDQRGGWAATARAVTNLADLATVSLSGTYSTVGFGSLEKNVQERSTEEVKRWDMSTNIDLGKFLPENSGIRIPVFYGVGEEIRDPRFNPLDTDIEFENSVANLDTKEERDSLKLRVQDYTRRKSFNLTNLRKERTFGGGGGGGGGGGRGPGLPGGGRGGSGGGGGSQQQLWDIENFSLTYTYNEIYRRDVTTDFSIDKDIRGQLNYNFNTSPKNVRPFSNVGFLRKSKWLRLLSEANFYYMPSRLSFRADARRQYSETLLRNNSDALLLIEPNFNKAFTFDRIYDVKWDLTKNIKIDYTATSNNRIDEPDGAIDDSARSVIWDNFRTGGRNTGFHQTTNINWQVPLNYIPLTDWINLTYRYTANYDWQAASLVAPEFGNIIQNSNTGQWNGQANLVQLYNKIPYLRQINQPRRNNRNNRNQQKSRTKANPDGDSNEEEEEEEKDPVVLNALLRGMMMLRNITATYNTTNGMMLPGYTPDVDYIGLKNVDGQWAPTLGFVFGSQRDIRQQAASSGWLTLDTAMNNMFTRTRSENLNLRAIIEPINDFRIEVNATRQESYRYQSIYRYDPATDEFSNLSPVETGNFNTSFLSVATAFEPIGVQENDFFSQAYQNFLDFRPQIANRIAAERGAPLTDSDGDGYPDGFGPTSRDVLVTSFLAAYSGADPGQQKASPFIDIPLPNWRINYDGLTKIKFFKDRFRSITISHAYRSTYQIGNYQTDLRFEDANDDGFSDLLDDADNFIPQFQIAQVSIQESFSPLIKFDATMLNSLIASIEMSKTRNLALNFSNNQLTEIRGNEYAFELGYRFKDVTFIVNSGGSRKRITSDLNVKAGVSIRQNLNVVRRIVEQTNNATGGQTLVNIKVSADYIISQRFNVRAFFDRTVTRYETSMAFDTWNTNVGISLRFILGQ